MLIVSALISRFTERCVWVDKTFSDDTKEPAALEGAGGFPNYVMILLHCLRIYLDTTYQMTIDLLKEMPQISREIGLEPAYLPHRSMLCLAFDNIEMAVCRTLLQQSAELHDTGPVGAIDATYFERSLASRSYCNKMRYEVQDLKVTKLVDTETNVILD